MNLCDIRRITIVGAGLMGHGIAQEFALAGYEVYMQDVTEDKLRQATENIRTNLTMLRKIGLVAEKKNEHVLPHIRSSTRLEEAVRDADVVFEAVFEDLELKQQLFEQLDDLCPEHTILASNTSTIMPSKLGSVTRRPAKVLVTHYYNPPYLLPLVEIVPGEKTSDDTVNVTTSLLTSVGKKPALIRKEVPGFIGNRLQVALAREALSIVQNGIADPEDVDIVIKNSFGRRLAVAGVFEVFDMAGWDMCLAIGSYLMPEIDSSLETLSLLKEKVERGELGIKSGKGFYDWTSESAENARNKIAQALIRIAQYSNGP
jgi:3-hydroxybutyryl-CoA dehydrogenase